MFIDSIELYNFRAYKGVNKVSFEKNGKNVFLVAGNNGFGKTTFLTSLVWCLYGKLMIDVDEKFRRDINDAQGYKNFAKANLNQESALLISEADFTNEDKKHIAKNGYGGTYGKYEEDSKYHVEIHMTDVFIPAIPCSEITIKRTYDYLLETENIEVLIDGHVNELAKEVGYDIFINDFILSKDIAKFFLFDAEKIVNLAEIKSVDEKRKLSTAYSEVLGIKKYEDIKRNLENLRIKFRKKGGASVSQIKLGKLTADIEKIEQSIGEKERERALAIDSIAAFQTEKDSLQEKLIREGNAMSVEELARLKAGLEAIKEKDLKLKSQLREMLDIAPFAISGKLFCEAIAQSELEQRSKTKRAKAADLADAMRQTRQNIIEGARNINLTSSQKELLESIIESSFSATMAQYNSVSDEAGVKVLLDFSAEEHNALKSLYDNIRLSYNITFRQLVKDIKNNTIFMQKTQRKISAAEYDDGDAEIRKARTRKAEVEVKLTELESSSRKLSEEIGILNKDLSIKKKQLSESLKLVRVEGMDKEKDAMAERLINELNAFLTLLKNKRKSSLASKIKSEIDVLMHKTDFIHSVSIDILDNIIEINLMDKERNVINKEKLSKGEQQLYATAILKALVEESGISFPVFIDSPLQKFDSIHSKNIISKFYPTVSKQVVIFPLLGKELSPSEYDSLLPNVNRAYVIQNQNGRSSFLLVDPKDIFKYVD